jgi:ubiquinone/menaquinone biosynthesis C-methylase UbiE/uncharacterized protein YcfL
VAKSLGFSNEKFLLDTISSAVMDTFLVSSESDSLTAEIRELANRLKIPPISNETLIRPKKPIEFQQENSNVNIEFEKHFISSKLVADKSIYRSVCIKNIGESILSSNCDKPVFLSYHWLDNDGHIVEFEGIRSHIPKPLYPNQSVSVIANIKTPKRQGKYILKLLPVLENIRWIEENGLEIEVEIIKKINQNLENIPIYHQDFDFNSDQEIAKAMITSHISEHFQNKKLRILEICAGIFPQSIYLTKLNCEIISTDISFSMCQLGLLFYSYVNKSFNKNSYSFMSCDAFNLPFVDSIFDGCIIFAALHHFSDPIKLLLYLKNLVKKDGFFAIMREPCNPNPFDIDYLRDIRSGINEQMWSIEEYLKIFDDAKLKIHSSRIDSNCSLKVILKSGD